jgi:hypothetical protein
MGEEAVAAAAADDHYYNLSFSGDFPEACSM